MREGPRRTLTARWLIALFAAALLVCGLAPVRAWAEGGAVYVSAEGDDSRSGASEQDAVQTLAQAVEIAADGDTIYVMSDLKATGTAKVWEKHITIESYGRSDGGAWTITRSKDFSPTNDTRRSGYNGAMIEVGAEHPSGEGEDFAARLTLKNIVLDDNGIHAGTYFIQAIGNTDTPFIPTVTVSGTSHIMKGATGSYNNNDIVQDAIVASYDGTGEIVLDEGSSLRNYGGISAVYVAGGSKLHMLSGSSICDTVNVERATATQSAECETCGKTHTFDLDFGPAGAVWIHGSEVEVDQGASIHDLTGRVLYNEGGSVYLNGSISGITSADIWQGNSDFIAHLRIGASMTMGSNAVVDNEGVSQTGGPAAFGIWDDCTFTMNEGAEITNVTGVGTLFYTERRESEITINGEISNCVGGFTLFQVQYADHNKDTDRTVLTIGPSADIHDNTTSTAGIIYVQGEYDVHLYGTIRDNVTGPGGAIWMANNDYGMNVTMYDGAKITGNVSSGSGGGAIVSCGTFTMLGGIISDNHTTATGEGGGFGGGVAVRRGGTFVMNGGTISNNSSVGAGGNIAILSSDYKGLACGAQLNDGEIESGKMNVTASKGEDRSYSFTGGVSNDVAISFGNDGDNGDYGRVDRYLAVSSAVDLSNSDIFVDEYDFYIANPGDGVKINNASADCESAVTEAYKDAYLTEIKGSFWYQSGSSTQTFSLGNLQYDSSKQLVAAYLATDEDGKPASGAQPALVPAEIGGDGRVSVTVPGGGNGYAVMLLQENDESRGIISLVPADLTAYVGGEGGYGSVEGPDGTSEGFIPRPVFRLVSAPADTNVEDFVFTNKITDAGGSAVSENSWKLVKVDTVGDGDYYRFEKNGETTADVRLQFTDADNDVTIEKIPTPDIDEGLYKTYSVSIYSGAEDGQKSEVTVTKGSEPYTPVIGFGTLTVRAVADDDPTTEVLDSKPESLEAGHAVAVAPSGTTYTLGDTGITLPADSKPSLLFDSIIDSESVDRTAALLACIEGATADNSQAMYLDLVDANNGNAWIKADGNVTVYWALPEDAPDDAIISLWHFKGLHRDADGSGFDVAEIAASEQVSVDVEKEGSYVVFDVEPGGFSPYVLTWAPATYTVTYTDGVDGETVFPDQVYANLSNGDPTPAFNGAPTRSGYTFTGWKPEVAETVTGDATYVAQWEKNSVTPPATKYYEIDASAGEGGTISPSGTVKVKAGDDQPFTITPAEGNRVMNVTIDGKSFGPLGSYTFEDVSADHTISVTFAPGNAPADPGDTGVDQWFDVTNHNAFMHGYDDGTGTFGPNDNMSRSHAAQMFYNMLSDKSKGDIETSFPDVEEDAWYYEAVTVLASRGIVKGDDFTGTFRPSDPISRAEFTAMAMRFSKGDYSGENIFTDVDEDSWYYDYVVGSVKYGWIVGYQDGSHRFGPSDTLKRAQAATIANRMLARVPDGVWISAHLDDLKLFPDVDREHYAFFDIVEATNSHDYTKDGGFEHWTGLK